MMESVQDFEDMLALLDNYRVEYLIIGGLAFIYHAQPRYTKDIHLWINPAEDNIHRANLALAEFGSPLLLHPDQPDQIVQLGVAPDRIDLLISVGVLDFPAAWEKRIVSRYGQSPANWIDLDSLIQIKESIGQPKHQEDTRILRNVKALRQGPQGSVKALGDPAAGCLKTRFRP